MLYLIVFYNDLVDDLSINSSIIIDSDKLTPKELVDKIGKKSGLDMDLDNIHGTKYGLKVYHKRVTKNYYQIIQETKILEYLRDISE